MYYSFRCDCGYDATLAQSVERFTRNEKVAGSIPACGSRQNKFIYQTITVKIYRNFFIL